jgi:hypothetical protein
LFALLLPAFALAADPVLHAGTGAEALSAVGRVTGEPDDAFVLISIETLLTGSITVVGGPQPPACPGPGVEVLSLWDIASNKVEPRIVRQDFERALPLLDQAIAQLPCLKGTVERSLGAQLHFLRGLSAYALGDSAAAERNFLRVLDYDRSFVYPTRHSAEAKPLFDELSSRQRREGTLSVLSDVAAKGTLVVDGNLMDGPRLKLPAGQHLVQIAGEATWTALIDLRADDGVALVGDGAVLLDSVDLPEGAAALDAIAASRLSGSEVVYVEVKGIVWRGPGTWQRIGTASAAELARARRATALRSAGVTALSVGAAGALGGLGWSLLTRDDTETSSDAEYYEALGAARTRRVWIYGSAGVATLGAALTGVGLSMGPSLSLSLPVPGVLRLSGQF